LSETAHTDSGELDRTKAAGLVPIPPRPAGLLGSLALEGGEGRRRFVR